MLLITSASSVMGRVCCSKQETRHVRQTLVRLWDEDPASLLGSTQYGPPIRVTFGDDIEDYAA